MSNETMVVCPHERGGYAVRPLEWTGIWDEKGRLKSSCNFTALFREKTDAEEYCKICNNPLNFSATKIRNALLEHGALWDAFLVCTENTLKERMMPFVPEREIAEAVLRRIVGDEESANNKLLGGEVSFETTESAEEIKAQIAWELRTVDVTGFSEKLILRVLSLFPETEKMITTDPAHYETLKCLKGFRYVPGGDDLLYGRSLVRDYEKQIKAAKVCFSVEKEE